MSSSQPHWKERFDLRHESHHFDMSEFFTIKYFIVDDDDEQQSREECLLGYIDWCSEDYLSFLEIMDMGTALGLEDDCNYRYYWRRSDDPGCNSYEILGDKEVMEMAGAVKREEAGVQEEPTEANVNGEMEYDNEKGHVEAGDDSEEDNVNDEMEDDNEQGNVEAGDDSEEDSDDNELYDSDYSFNGDEDMEDEEAELNKEAHAKAQDGKATKGNVGGEGTSATEPIMDCPSSEYEDSDQLVSEDDSDNEGVERPRYPEFMEENMSNPKLEVGMKFNSFHQFKEACRNYGIRNRYVLSFNPNDKKRCKAICKKTCPFYLWAGLMNKDDLTVQIKSGVLTHNCSKNHHIKHCNARWLSKEYLEQFRADPTWKLDGIVQVVRTNQKCEISKVVAYKAKKDALQILNGDETEQFSYLHDYRLELIRTHPTSTIKFKLDEGVFRGMYVCLAPLRDGFKDGCRNVVCMDGCWLKGVFGMQLLTAVGIDANDCIYPVAWAIVNRENMETWKWFLELLGNDLEINHSLEWAFMSDRQKGLINAIDELFPHAEHRYCAGYILSNFMTRFKGKALKDALWNCARSRYGAKFREEMQVLEGMSKEAHAYLAGIDPAHWSRSHFDTKFKCDMLLNNLFECFNAFILDARTKGFITMNEMIRTMLMKRIQKKRALMLRTEEEFCPKIRKKLDKAKTVSWYYRADWSGGDKYQVSGSDGQFVVDKGDHSCTCRRWQLTSIPCHHAIAAMNLNNENPEMYLHNCYRVSTYLKIYGHFLNPTNGKQLWPKSNHPLILAPEHVNKRRRRKALIRRGEADEVQRGGQGPFDHVRISRRGGQMKCSSCGGKGQNVRSCRGKQMPANPTATQPPTNATTPTQPHEQNDPNATQPPPPVQPDVMTQQPLVSQVEILTLGVDPLSQSEITQTPPPQRTVNTISGSTHTPPTRTVNTRFARTTHYTWFCEDKSCNH